MCLVSMDSEYPMSMHVLCL